jgi:flagella basal body P-ring formation protein FlgA
MILARPVHSFPTRSLRRSAAGCHRVLTVLVILALGSGSSSWSVRQASAQQPPAWRIDPTAPATATLPSASLRVALKTSSLCQGNLVELADIAELNGPEELVQQLNAVLLGPAPRKGERQRWTQAELLRILEWKGIQPTSIRWAGADACEVIHQAPEQAAMVSEIKQAMLTPPMIAQAERTVSNVLTAYLQTRVPGNTGWIVHPQLPPAHLHLLTERRAIIGVDGGEEPFTGEQNFRLLLRSSEGEQAITVTANIQLPPLIWGAVGPLSKGRVLQPEDLKLVRLTASMKAKPEECFAETSELLGKELRRNISTGQPIQRLDVGPPRVVQVKDLVKIQVLAGSIVAETTGRALQAGGIDEVIEVEVSENKKRLAARIRSSDVVEVIAR